MIAETINRLLNIKESFEMPNRLMEILLSERCEKFLQEISGECDLERDCFRDYFQEEHAERDKYKQDFTPDCIVDLIAKLAGNGQRILDECSGTGALTIGMAAKNSGEYYQCEELTSRALPVMICNLALRNINGTVKQKNVLTGETEHVYKLSAGEKFSRISEAENSSEEAFDICISNPPYSLPWEPPTPIEAAAEKRFQGYDIPPKSKADYAFVLDIISRISNNGRAFIVLPHGVLFRGAQEGKIREQLIENNLIDAVIGLPEKLFLNTGILVCIIVINKRKTDRNILVIDGSKLYKKGGKQNTMTAEQLAEIASAFRERKSVPKLAAVVDFEEIQRNEFNLNIPRYVDTSEPKPEVDLGAVAAELIELDVEIRKTSAELAQMMKKLCGTTPEAEESYRKNIAPIIEFLENGSKSRIVPEALAFSLDDFI